jgi:hypothetical protein
MTESKPKPSTPTKPGLGVKKPGLVVKPVKDLEPDESQSEDVRGGVPGPGKLYSDAGLKRQIAPIRGALVRLREFQF